MSKEWDIHYKHGDYAVRRSADGYEIGVFEHYTAYRIAEKMNAMPVLPDPGLKQCTHAWTHQTRDIWCCENCGTFAKRALA